MCLTGVDYFSTLGYQPAIAADIIAAQRFVDDCAPGPGPGPVKIIANEPDPGDEAEYRAKLDQVVEDHHVPDPHRALFLEVGITDPSDFETELDVTGTEVHGYRVLRTASPSVPNGRAAAAPGGARGLSRAAQ